MFIVHNSIGGHMQAIREIKQVESNSVTINIPDAFMAKRVEIIVLPLDDDGVNKKEERKVAHNKPEMTPMPGKLADTLIFEDDIVSL
ncbi:MAG: hypothetical protein GY757_25685 [bacterium]|nr:hypothetical protein [bacterium]